MDQNNRRKTGSDIDEEAMMNLMVDGVKKEGLRVPEQTADLDKENRIGPRRAQPVKEKDRTKNKSQGNYESIFFKKAETNARDGKTVYIRPDFHEKLSRIVQVIGEDKITIYAYLDNLLDYHFQEFGEQITKSFNEKYKPIL